MESLHCIESGDGEQSVVLLHGLFGSASNLAALAKALEPNFRVFRLDLRNHGRSFHSEQMDLPLLAEDVRRFLIQRGIERAWVVGHSLGGKVAMQLALMAPERVAGLVVADIAPVDYPRHHDAILRALKGIDLRALRNREQADENLRGAVDEKAVRQFLLKNLARSPEGEWSWRMNLSAIDRAYDALRKAPQGDAYAGPVLFIKGELSDYLEKAYLRPIQQLFPAASFKLIQGAGHWLHAEKPAVFNQLVCRFLLTGGD